DAILAVSEKLDPLRGGASFRPTADEVVHPQINQKRDPDDESRQRRSIYRLVINSAKDPIQDALDCPDPSVKTPRRSVTTTPLQALGLMNNSFVLRQARGLAERVSKEAGDNEEAQVERAYRLVSGRKPTEAEPRRALELAKEHGM